MNAPDAGVAAAKALATAAGAAIATLPTWVVIVLAMLAHPGSRLLLAIADSAIVLLRAWVSEATADLRQRSAIRRAAARRDQLAQRGLTPEDLREALNPAWPSEGPDPARSQLGPSSFRPQRLGPSKDSRTWLETDRAARSVPQVDDYADTGDIRPSSAAATAARRGPDPVTTSPTPREDF